MRDQHPVYALDYEVEGLIPTGGRASAAPGAKAAATRAGFTVRGVAVPRKVLTRGMVLAHDAWVVPVASGHPWARHPKNASFSTADDAAPRSNPPKRRAGTRKARRNPAVAEAPAKTRRAFVTILHDGVSDDYAVVTFLGRSSAGRRRVEGAAEAFALARRAADDLLRRGVAPEVRLTFAVERRETGIEVRRIGPSGRIEASPLHLSTRHNPSKSRRGARKPARRSRR